MPVPAVIKSLFDSVPLKTYNDDTPVIEGAGIRYFEGNSKAQLTLGVFNLFECQGRAIPTDPISLGTALILGFKNGLKLPSKDAGTASGPGIMKMSLYGSPNKVLPILIETSESRTIRTLDEINHSIAANNFKDEETKLINDLIDTVFYDTWIMCVLTENPPVTQMFGLERSIVSQAEWQDFMSEVPSWNHFARRHPNLSGQHLANFYDQQLTQFERDLDLIIANLEENPNDVIRFKLAGYLIIIDHFLQSTKLGAIVSQKPFVKSCYELLN
ncbi:Sorting assembly machinery subunit [Candida viswanathii]|uniref:Sorting assembly machinery subunit n=1 Tax=Candida viswanathii TaxID=5486 RepID=A0A367YG30_9ASCO|nr:Sorting assembly machinery subunit [Candida viswanathii]